MSSIKNIAEIIRSKSLQMATIVTQIVNPFSILNEQQGKEDDEKVIAETKTESNQKTKPINSQANDLKLTDDEEIKLSEMTNKINESKEDEKKGETPNDTKTNSKENLSIDKTDKTNDRTRNSDITIEGYTNTDHKEPSTDDNMLNNDSYKQLISIINQIVQNKNTTTIFLLITMLVVINTEWGRFSTFKATQLKEQALLKQFEDLSKNSKKMSKMVESTYGWIAGKLYARKTTIKITGLVLIAFIVIRTITTLTAKIIRIIKAIIDI